MPQDPREAAELIAEDILANIELRDIELSGVMLKCARLARLLKDEANRKIFSYEAGGYPSEIGGIPAEVFELGRIAGRVYQEKSGDSFTEKMSTSSIDALEKVVTASQTALASAADRDVSISSANPHQMVFAPAGNQVERNRHAATIKDAAKTIARSRAYAYEYATAVLYEIQFSEVVSGIFSDIRENADLKIIKHVPAATNKMEAINDNLQSENPEDWANAVHGCRRLLQDLADAIFPPQDDRTLQSGKVVKLGQGNYINRIMSFIEDHSSSRRYNEIVGSTLTYMGERLDAVFQAAQKGSHAEIDTRAEAERYVIYTYLTVGDVLSLMDEPA